MKTAVSIFILIFCNPVFSQGKESLLKQIRASRDTIKVKHLFEYGFYLESVNLDSAAYYYQQAGKLSKKLHYTSGILKYYSNYTYILNQKGQLKKGQSLNLEALAFARKNGKPRDIADCLFNVGSSYNNLGDFEQALQYYLDAAKIFEELNDEPTLVTVYDNIGGVYTNSKQYKKALEYHDKAYLLAKKLKDQNSSTKVLINKGITEIRLKDLKSAKRDLEMGLCLSSKMKNPYLQIIAYSSLSEVMIVSGENEKSLLFARKAYSLGLEIKSNYAQSEALKGLTASFEALGNPDSTIFYGKKALLFGTGNQYENELYEIYRYLAYAYEDKGDFKTSLDYYKKYKVANDSVQKREVSVKMQRIQNEFKEARSQNEIWNLQSSKKKQQLIIVILIVGLGVISLVTFLFYTNNKSKRKLIEQEMIRLKSEEDLKAVQIILETQEEERLRIAKDLHDGLGGLLSGIKLTLQNSESGIMEKHELNALKQLDSAIGEMRRISHSMMPESLSKFGLVDALTDMCKSFEGNKQFTLSYQFFGFSDRLPADLETNIYRIIMELLNNAIKHSQAREIYLQLIQSDGIIAVTIEDDGVGFEMSKFDKSVGIGFRNIESRLKLIGGAMDIHSKPGDGTTINLEIRL